MNEKGYVSDQTYFSCIERWHDLIAETEAAYNTAYLLTPRGISGMPLDIPTELDWLKERLTGLKGRRAEFEAEQNICHKLWVVIGDELYQHVAQKYPGLNRSTSIEYVKHLIEMYYYVPTNQQIVSEPISPSFTPTPAKMSKAVEFGIQDETHRRYIRIAYAPEINQVWYETHIEPREDK